MKIAMRMLVLTMVLTAVLGSSFSASAADKQKAADFSLQDLGGSTVTLSALKGKVVLLNFWATWCPSCVSEMPSLNKLYGEMKSRGLEIIAVSTDGSASSVRDFVETHKLRFPIVMDVDRDVIHLYHVFSLPTSFLINKQGIVVQKFYGEYDWMGKETREKIEKLL